MIDPFTWQKQVQKSCTANNNQNIFNTFKEMGEKPSFNEKIEYIGHTNTHTYIYTYSYYLSLHHLSTIYMLRL